MSPAAELFDKYSELVALRMEVGTAAHSVRERLQRLAARFPGALRELDALPFDELARRKDAVKRAMDSGDAAPWMDRMARYHRLLSGALVAKRWLSRRGSDEDRAGAFENDNAATDAIAWRDSLDEVSRPPDGRLSTLALRRVARERDEDDEIVRTSLLRAV